MLPGSKEYAELQAKSTTTIHDGSFVCNITGQPKVITVAPPIHIFHPGFQEFLDRSDDPEFEPDREVITQVSRLTLHSSRIYPSEDTALSELRKLITDLLGGYATRATSPESRDSDGIIIFKHEGSCNLPLVLLEYKRVTDEGG